MFAVAKFETGNGLDACNTCELLPTKQITEGNISDVDTIIFEVENIVNDWHADGGDLDWGYLDVELYPLFLEYRKAEREVEKIQMFRWQTFLKSKFESS